MLTLAIVGRPNVGKSTLYNRLIGRRQAIVDDLPGVTRDRLYGEMIWNGRKIRVIDTGGYLSGEKDRLGRAIVENAEAGIREADVVVMITDGNQDVTPADQDLADLVRPLRKPVILAVNKIDHVSHEPQMYPFYELGLEQIMPISALHGSGVADMLDRVVELAPEKKDEEDEGIPPISITILGRPNVGKSTLLNKLAGSERSLVDPAPGTTRDPVDTVVKRENRYYRFVDTAGIRAAGKIGSNIERYGIVRAKKTLERSDVALLLIDAEEGPTERDARVFRLAHDSGRASIILVNKWDTVEKETGTAEAFEREIRRIYPFLHYAPVLFISALSGQRVHRIYQLIDEVYEAAQTRLQSSQLGKLLEKIKAVNPPPYSRQGSVNMYYWAQTGVKPIQINLYVNKPKGLPENYRRYLINQVYENFKLTGTPLQLYVKKSPEKEARRKRAE